MRADASVCAIVLTRPAAVDSTVSQRSEMDSERQTKETEELTETVEITEDIDPDQEIEEEVRTQLTPLGC